jgi:hypothetical protein
MCRQKANTAQLADYFRVDAAREGQGSVAINSRLRAYMSCAKLCVSKSHSQVTAAFAWEVTISSLVGSTLRAFRLSCRVG